MLEHWNMQMKASMLMVFCYILTTTSSVANVHGLGGGCFGEDSNFEEKVAHDYQTYFSVRPSPSTQAIHLTLRGPREMRVTWMNPTTWSNSTKFSPMCRYGVTPTSLNSNVIGVAYSYPEGQFTYTLNTAILHLMSVSSQSGVYFYSCGDNSYGWSQVLNFTLQSVKAKDNVSSFDLDPKPTTVASPTIAMVGDMGVMNGEYTIASIARRVNAGEVQLLVHAGDISYADVFDRKTHNNSYVWVEYMNQLQSIVSRVPYMVAPGNHEAQFKFAAYLNWLQMPYKESSSTSPFWFSFDYLGIHFVSMSTEHDFRRNSTQYLWLEKDLKRANQNRDNVPWIIVFGHRPLYCTSIVCLERCDVEAPRYRAELEDLLYHQRVDIYLCGHNHQYERTYPVYKEKIVQHNYTAARATVYIVNGAAGNPEYNDPTFMPFVKWRAFDEPTFDTGYLLMQPTKWDLSFQYVLSKDDKVVDTFTVSKSRH